MFVLSRRCFKALSYLSHHSLFVPLFVDILHSYLPRIRIAAGSIELRVPWNLCYYRISDVEI